MEGDIDLTEDIKSLVEPLVSNADAILVKRTDKPEDAGKREQNYLILCDKEDLGKLIGRHGIISDSIRTLLNVSMKNDHKKVRLRFDDFDSFNNGENK
ncbi:MAG: KH domain-containing protein [Bacilli bacterium]|jgi:predicted RNA-binding protein YlqC (UPF0109 family)|nr:KH domain-containing protein [Bacilli bacterium]MCH3966566.1 KH domain-containing protein [Bacilli bacterium]